MVEEVWLHIGTPKSGTSSLQKYLMEHRQALSAQGLAYLSPPGKPASNDLAIAINRNRPERAEMAEALNHAIEKRPEKRALISSEMFYGMAPELLFSLMPALAERPLKVLVYLRRQDRYIEAMFVQKSKNGRFLGSIMDYIAKFEGSGSDYHTMLAPWQKATGDVTLVPRILERDRLTGGDVVADAFARIGLAPPDVAQAEDVNVSPGLHRVQLLQAAAAVGFGNPRRVQRLLSVRYPQRAEDRGAILNDDERREFLAQFAEGNEALRARYFPGQPSLFAMDDIGREKAGIAPFTPEQLVEISRLLETLKSLE